MRFGRLGGFCPGCQRFCYLVLRVVHMFMLLATMDIWYLHVLLTIQSLTSNLRVTIFFQLPKNHNLFRFCSNLEFLSCCFGTSVQLAQLTIDEEFYWHLLSQLTMDDGVDLPSHLLLSHPAISHGHGFDDFLESTAACTHTHTCNPPGPSAVTHTHTCLHTHRQFIGSGEELIRAPRKPLGNREAVRKYREKKKAHAAFLEEEVKKLRATNQQLLRRLQRHAALEAEVARLRGLLFDVQGKIDVEIGAFTFEKHRSFGSVICTDPALCFVNGDDAEVAAPEESSGPTNFDFEIDESGSISREFDMSEVVNSMDAAASLVNSASLAE